LLTRDFRPGLSHSAPSGLGLFVSLDFASSRQHFENLRGFAS